MILLAHDMRPPSSHNLRALPTIARREGCERGRPPRGDREQHTPWRLGSTPSLEATSRDYLKFPSIQRIGDVESLCKRQRREEQEQRD